MRKDKYFRQYLIKALYFIDVKATQKDQMANTYYSDKVFDRDRSLLKFYELYVLTSPSSKHNKTFQIIEITFENHIRGLIYDVFNNLV